MFEIVWPLLMFVAEGDLLVQPAHPRALITYVCCWRWSLSSACPPSSTYYLCLLLKVISKFSLPTLEHDIPRVDYNPVGKSHCLLNCKVLKIISPNNIMYYCGGFIWDEVTLFNWWDILVIVFDLEMRIRFWFSRA